MHLASYISSINMVPMNTQGHGYSLWIAPDKEHRNAFSKLINKFGRICKSPIFEPHVTLLGDIKGNKKEILEKTKKLSKKLRPYEIKKAAYSRHHSSQSLRSIGEAAPWLLCWKWNRPPTTLFIVLPRSRAARYRRQ